MRTRKGQMCVNSAALMGFNCCPSQAIGILKFVWLHSLRCGGGWQEGGDRGDRLHAPRGLCRRLRRPCWDGDAPLVCCFAVVPFKCRGCSRAATASPCQHAARRRRLPPRRQQQQGRPPR